MVNPWLVVNNVWGWVKIQATTGIYQQEQVLGFLWLVGGLVGWLVKRFARGRVGGFIG